MDWLKNASSVLAGTLVALLLFAVLASLYVEARLDALVEELNRSLTSEPTPVPPGDYDYDLSEP